MTITVDTREKFIDRIKEIIIDVEDAPQFQFKALDFGDYDLLNAEKQLRIERKSINDFCGSFGTLKSRLHNMRLTCQYTALLLEGTYSVSGQMLWVQEGFHMQPRMSYQTFSNFLTHQASLGTWIFHTMSFEESIIRLINIYNYLPKLDIPDTFKCGNPTEWILQLPGIGKTNMTKLRETHATPLEAINDLPKRSKEALEHW